MHRRRLLSLLLCVCLVLSSVPAVRTDAKPTDSIIYQQDGVEVLYGVDSSWSGAFNAHIVIRNLSHADIENWGLQFGFSNDIVNIWNGKILSTENGSYTVKNLGYNQDIKNGSEVSFGFIANGDPDVLPDGIVLCSKEYVVEDGYLAEFSVNSDWGSGFSGTIELSNTGKEAIEDWTLEFDLNRDIDNIWNGSIIKHEGIRYIVKNADYNQRILPGQSITIGFNGHQGNVGTETVTNVSLSSFGSMPKNNPKDTERKVRIDTSKLIIDGDNVYYIPKDVYSISGTVEDSANAIKLVYSSNNTYGLDILSGELAVGEKWTIENIPLIIGYNELTVTAVYNDNTVSSDNIIIANMYKDKTAGLEDLLVDSDMDGLEDYIEAIQGTDPLLKDTDGDGLSDYTELVDMGTDPLEKDTDGDGIFDGDEDYDEDGLSNKEEEILGTLLYGIDSDYDGLTDYDEVRVYLTNPLLKDTDGDGASDGFEVENGYDPLHAETSFTVNREVFAGGTTYELQLTSSGENIESLEAEPINDSAARYGLIAGYLDPAVDFKINGSFESAKLKVSFDEAYLDIEGFVPALYYIDEENHEMVEIPGEWDGVSNYFYVELPHFSAYITINKTNFIKVWENGIKAHAYTQDGKTNLNLVFVTDLSGSMGRDRIYTLKDSLNEFIGVLTPTDKAAIVSFTSYATVLSQLTSNKSTLKEIVNAMSVRGTTAIYTGLDKAVEILEDTNVDGVKMIIVFTDGYDEPSTTYEDQYKAIVDRAVDADITIHTVGIGTIDSELLTNIAHSTGGSFYYAESASTLKQQVTKVQEDVIDYTTDSNNDGISDYFTRLLCEGKLITWDHQPVIVTASYDDIQNDSDGDYDNDGLRNGWELLFTTKEDQVISIIVNSDMEKVDTDGDSYSDKVEKDRGTNPKIKDILESDFNGIIVNHSNFAASQAANDYIDSDFTKFRLSITNLLFNCKIDYVKDYEIALIKFINAYNETTIEETIFKKWADYYEQDWLQLVHHITETGISAVDNYGDLAKYVQELKVAKDQLIGATRAYSLTKHKVSSVAYETRRVAFEKCFNETNELQTKYGKLPEKMLKWSPKAQKFLKVTGNVLTGASFVAQTADDVVNTVYAFASLNAEFELYDNIIEFLTIIVDNSEIDELKQAAYKLRAAISSNISRNIQNIEGIFQDIGENIGQLSTGIVMSYFGPFAWAASLGLALGDILGGTGAVAEESLKLIALGHSADIFADHIRFKYMRDNNTSYYLVKDDEQLQLIQLLSQLRIVGEDCVGKDYDEYGPVMQGLYFLAGASQDEIEADLKNRISRIEDVGERLGFFVTGKFVDNYLYENE